MRDTLQHTTRRHTLQVWVLVNIHTVKHCNTLQHTANTLQRWVTVDIHISHELVRVSSIIRCCYSTLLCILSLSLVRARALLSLKFHPFAVGVWDHPRYLSTPKTPHSDCYWSTCSKCAARSSPSRSCPATRPPCRQSSRWAWCRESAVWIVMYLNMLVFVHIRVYMRVWMCACVHVFLLIYV